MCLRHLRRRNRPEEKQQTDLGVAPVKDGGVDVVVPTDEKDINAAYEVRHSSCRAWGYVLIGEWNRTRWSCWRRRRRRRSRPLIPRPA